MTLTGFKITVKSLSLRGLGTPPGLESGQTPAKSKPEGRFVVSRESKVNRSVWDPVECLGGRIQEGPLNLWLSVFFGVCLLFREALNTSVLVEKPVGWSG